MPDGRVLPSDPGRDGHVEQRGRPTQCLGLDPVVIRGVDDTVVLVPGVAVQGMRSARGRHQSAMSSADVRGTDDP